MKKIIIGSLAITVLCLTGCSNKRKLTVDSLPWEMSTPKTVGINEAMIDSFDHDIQQGDYGWWLGLENGKPVSYNMQGCGGQFVVVVPDFNMMLVTNGWNIHQNNRKMMNGIFSRIFPAIQ